MPFAYTAYWEPNHCTLSVIQATRFVCNCVTSYFILFFLCWFETVCSQSGPDKSQLCARHGTPHEFIAHWHQKRARVVNIYSQPHAGRWRSLHMLCVVYHVHKTSLQSVVRVTCVLDLVSLCRQRLGRRAPRTIHPCHRQKINQPLALASPILLQRRRDT